MKKTTAVLAASLVAVFAVAALAFAGMHGYGMFTSNIGDMDSNQDELITFEEYESFHSRDLRAAFDMLDINNDNVIDSAEWEQFLKVHGMTKSM